MADVDWGRLEAIIGGMEGPTWSATVDAGRGRQALGRFGVLSTNLPEWSREALGREVTAAEFLASPDIQRQIFRHRFGTYLAQTGGNAEHAAAMWFAGPSGFANRTPDRFGTTVDEYARRFRVASGGDTPPPMGPPTTRGVTTGGIGETPPTTDTTRQPPPTNSPPPPDIGGIVAEALNAYDRARQPDPARTVADAAASDIEPMRLPGMAPRRAVTVDQIRSALGRRRIGV